MLLLLLKSLLRLKVDPFLAKFEDFARRFCIGRKTTSTKLRRRVAERRCAQDDTQREVCNNRLILRTVEDACPYKSHRIFRAIHAVKFTITVRDHGSSWAPTPTEFVQILPRRHPTVSGKEKCRRTYDACIDRFGGVFVW